MLTAIDLQLQTLRLYGELVSRRENYGGQLIFTCGAGSSATGLSTAVSIAGGTTLALDPDAATVKSVFRKGGVDFVVNTLDEALRVLKNEIRQHRPLGVCLIAEIEPVLAEMTQRGVLPDLHITLDSPNGLRSNELEPPQQSSAVQYLHLATRDGIAAPTSQFTTWLDARKWAESIYSSTPETPLRVMDADILAALPSDDTIRRAWLQRISHYQRSTAGASRLLWTSQLP